MNRPVRIGLISTGLLLLIAGVLFYWAFWTPGKSYAGPETEPTDEEIRLGTELRETVMRLADDIGERNVENFEELNRAADFLDSSLSALGYQVTSQEYDVSGKTCRNIAAEIRGSQKPDEVVIVGAHYDSPHGSPGANDNGSGTAAVLALAERLAGTTPLRTLRFLCFTNEEPPWFQTDLMGSLVYARHLREQGENVVAMLSLETIGYYSDEEGSQKYPPLISKLYPSTGNFLAFVCDPESRSLMHTCLEAFRTETAFPSEGAALPFDLPGIGWSDHWSFRRNGYPALMLTDTAPFRYPHYHTPQDTPEKIDYIRMARVVMGIQMVVRKLVNSDT